MYLIIRIIALILVMFVSRNADLLDRNGAKFDRKITNINAAWDYLDNNTSDVALAIESLDWQQIDLLHTWNQWDAVDVIPGYRRDGSWYKKKLSIENLDKVRYLLCLEVVNMPTVVYVNGQKAGGHIGGYVGFEVDISEYLQLGPENEILVRVNNSYSPEIIPSQISDFFIYGGITKDVWLKRVPENKMEKIKISKPNGRLTAIREYYDGSDLVDVFSPSIWSRW